MLVQIFREAQDLLPGGVNSPVRAFKSVGGGPIVFDRVKGPYAWDVDGNKYIDYIGSWGPAIVGAANDEVNAALKAQIDKGTSFGAPCELEVGSFSTSHQYSLLLEAVSRWASFRNT
jgi:glutamate-1-semialdehyde 2,1-aminomutase